MPQLSVAAGDLDKIVGKVVYFVRDTKKPVKLSTAQDATVICGEIAAEILQSFEGTLSRVFEPVLAQQQEWGHIRESKDKGQFINQVHKFGEDLKRKVQNLRGDVELRQPEAPYDDIDNVPAAFVEPALDQKCIAHFSGVLLSLLPWCSCFAADIVKDWCNSISQYMNNDISSKPLGEHMRPPSAPDPIS